MDGPGRARRHRGHGRGEGAALAGVPEPGFGAVASAPADARGAGAVRHAVAGRRASATDGGRVSAANVTGAGFRARAGGDGRRRARADVLALSARLMPFRAGVPSPPRALRVRADVGVSPRTTVPVLPELPVRVALLAPPFRGADGASRLRSPRATSSARPPLAVAPRTARRRPEVGLALDDDFRRRRAARAAGGYSSAC